MNVGKIVGVNGNLLTVEFENPVIQNEVGFAKLGDIQLKAEVIRIRGNHAELQVFEDTVGLKVGDPVEFTGDLLSVELGPGLLTQVFDGLQNPLPALAEECGFFLQRGKYLKALPRDDKWKFSPLAKAGDTVVAGDAVGQVPEGIFDHKIMVPFRLPGRMTVKFVAGEGEFTVEDVVAVVTDDKGHDHDVKLMQVWPVKIPIKCYAERLRPTEPLATSQRIVDTFFPVARGGTYCIPGPFGAGKTVLQQITSRHADVDVVIIAACGERAGEVVETLREFPELTDPKTGKSLMERTLIICNTSSMPVAAREASVYTGVTLAEYYRSPTPPPAGRRRYAKCPVVSKRFPAKRRFRPILNPLSPLSTSAAAWSSSTTDQPDQLRLAEPFRQPVVTLKNPLRSPRSKWSARSTVSPALVPMHAAIRPSIRSRVGANTPVSWTKKRSPKLVVCCATEMKSAR